MAAFTPSPRRAAALALLLGAILAGCGQSVTGTGTTGARDVLTLSVPASGLPPVYVNEDYTATLPVAGGVGPYTLRLSAGALPPGLSLNSGARTLAGRATRTGAFNFTVEVTDSTLSTKATPFTLNVQELPPLAVAPQLPNGEVRGETRVPLVITAPRGVRALRATWTLPDGVRVTRVQGAPGGGLLYWRQAGRELRLDLGFKTVPRSGARVALVSVRPSRPVTLTGAVTVDARGADGKAIGAPAAAAPAAPPATTAPTAPASAPAPAAAPTAPGTGTATDPNSGAPRAPGSDPSASPAPAPAPTTPPGGGR